MKLNQEQIKTKEGFKQIAIAMDYSFKSGINEQELTIQQVQNILGYYNSNHAYIMFWNNIKDESLPEYKKMILDLNVSGTIANILQYNYESDSYKTIL